MHKVLFSAGLICGALFLAGCNQQAATTSAPDASPQATTAPVVDNSEGGQQLMQAYQTGAPLNCVIANATDGSSIQYVTKNKKMRSTTALPHNPSLQSFMINDGAYIYMWTSDQKTGFKSKVPTEAEMQAAADKIGTMKDELPDFSQAKVQEEYQSKGYSINCTPGAIDDSQFVPPTTIQFQDMSAMMQKAMEGMAEITPNPKMMAPPGN